MSYYVLVYMFIVSVAKIHLFLPTILYILTIHLYFLTFTHFLFFILCFPFLFVLRSKDFIVFLQKNQTTYQMKRNKKIFYTLLYIVGFISIWLMPLQAFGSIKLVSDIDGRTAVCCGRGASDAAEIDLV